jgi:hypothetical protein
VKALLYPIVAAFIVACTFSLVCEYGFVASQVWAWFAVPRGLPALSWQEATGGFLFLSLLRAKPVQPKNEKTPSEQASDWFAYFLVPWFVLFLAWMVR